jgi:golgi-specific brefeldin A-resistance guanine nucleotide exchange factor 1
MVIVSSQTEWNLVLALVRATIGHLEAPRASFALVKKLVEDKGSVTVDNALPLIAVLDDFATTAGMVAEAESQQQRARRRPTPEAKRCVLRWCGGLIGHCLRRKINYACQY